eukprot:gnl/Spiro4/3974_TR1979_c0_g1_i1.p1 gnl/Spiro4/3974_TR1979_c0_g1~~gnl/Spiro4/3974_TR1979_c0_g1_i1.p1  ORF type:complete len:248 (+),score=46.06 gnl/Spiro4/3974_TR1979_c0_g1_i1:40-783(+)
MAEGVRRADIWRQKKPKPPTNESIYNLIQPEQAPAPRGPLYKLDLPPLGKKRGHATMGPVKVNSPDPKSPLRKTDRRLGAVGRFEYSTTRRPPIPDSRNPDDRPIFGLQSKRDFIKYNAVNVILSEPNVPQDTSLQYRHKRDYGKRPLYLDQVKRAIDEEQQYIAALAEQAESQKQTMHMMPEEERRQLLHGLKANLETVKEQYARLPFIADTIGRKQRKEGLEAKMVGLEKDILALSRPRVFVQAE